MAIDTEALIQDQLERFDERAGIYEFDGNMLRVDAEIEAYKDLFGVDIIRSKDADEYNDEDYT